MRIRTLLTLSLTLLLACDEQTQPSTTEGASSSSSASSSSAPFTAQAAPSSDPTADAVVASWDGGQITFGELSGQIKNQLVQMESEYLNNRYAAQSGALEQMMIEKILEKEAAAQGVDGIEALLKREVESKIAPPTEQEIQEFYTVVKRQLRNAPLDAVRGQVEGELMRRKQAELAQTYIGQLKDKYKGATTLPFPDLPRIEVSVDDDPMLGDVNAPVTIVQFAEYQCPYCGKANDAVEKVLENYEGKVRMVYRDFPLSFHARAIPAAVAANCAGEQDKYWEMHRLLMANQGALEDANLSAHAQTLGLDLEKWNTCRMNPAQQEEVMADMKAGSEAGVSGTPAFFINGIMLSGALPYERFEEIIERELNRG
ncbi:MAG: thioredoxin domain-containing protein [Myxococcota bacterium]